MLFNTTAAIEQHGRSRMLAPRRLQPRADPNGGFHGHGATPIAEWFTRENPTNMDDLEVPPFMETPKCANTEHVLPSLVRFPCKLAPSLEP